MPEAEVALRLAEFILSLPGSGAMASVAIDGASIKVGDAVIFDIGWALHHPWELRNGKPFLGVLNGVLRARARFRGAPCELLAYDASASRRVLAGCAGT